MFGLCYYRTFLDALKLFRSQYDKAEYAKKQVWNKRFPDNPIIDDELHFEYLTNPVIVTFYRNSDSIKSFKCGQWEQKYTID